MDEIKDNIYDAYYLKKGEAFGKKVRNRIHWITQNVEGRQILDIGCSQGISSILLGREGKQVLGIDSSSSAIEDANSNLQLEEEDTRSNIRFVQTNFFTENITEKYDTVILGEVLEHITDINSFFNKAITLTKENGKIIVTTPFGINEFIDHKRTFYLKDLINLQTSSLKVEDIKFFGKWIGVIYRKDENKEETTGISNQLLEKLEQAFYVIEEEYLNKQKDLKRYIKNMKEKNEADTTNNEKLETLEKELMEEKVQKVKVQQELVEAYHKSETIIKDYRKMLSRYEALQNKYQNLKNSKLGKLTTKYWKLRNKRRSK